MPLSYRGGGPGSFGEASANLRGAAPGPRNFAEGSPKGALGASPYLRDMTLALPPRSRPRSAALRPLVVGSLLVGLAGIGQVACSSSDGSGGTGAPAGPSTSATGVFGTVRDKSGAPVTGATGTIAGATVTTDGAGSFKSKAPPGEHVVSVRAKGFADGFVRVNVSADTASAAHVRLLAMEGPFPVDATVGGTAAGSRGAKVIVPANGLVDAAGTPVTGSVDVFVTPVDPSDPVEGLGAPELLASSPSSSGQVALTSFGMLDVTIEQGGQRLQIAKGSTLTIRIPVPAGPTTAPATLPLWSFDIVKGLWLSEGTLTLDEANGVYEGNIPHLSWWNADIEEATGCVCGTVLDKAGKPVGGAQVRSSGVGYGGGSGTTTAADGTFCVATKLNAKVQITAIHADGGGEIRELDGGTVVAKLPLTDPAICAPGGTWTVEPGKVVFPDGSSTTCQQTLATLQSCVGDAFVSLFTCFDPSGSCESSGGLVGTNLTYANGAKVVSRIETGPPTKFTTEYFASNGKSCGTQVTNVAGTDSGSTSGSANVTITTPGGSTSYSFATDGEGGSTIGCLDGSSITLTGAETAALESCGGGDGEDCTQTGGGGDGFSCVDSDCNGDDVCCGGAFCTTREACGLGVSCETQADCVGEEVCCIVGTTKSQNVCRDKSTCAAAKGGCKADTECNAGALCCAGECTEVAFCGECGSSADCKDQTAPYCCQNGGNLPYCGSDAASCFSGQECTSDAQCAEAGMICCDDGGSSSCQTAKTCFGGKACTSNADCPGLYCCDDPEAFTFNSCAPQNECNVQKPCSSDADCNTGACCAEGSFAGVCVPEVGFCYQGSSCTSNADCGPDTSVTCCAPYGNLCVKDCPTP
jgi:hypothetical protein